MNQQHYSKAAQRGVPSLVWRAGQQRRFAMTLHWANLTRNSRVLVVGSGVGAYATHLAQFTSHTYAFDIERDHATATSANVPNTHIAAAEAIPYAASTFDLAFSHEVIEHVSDDRAALSEMARTLRPGGRAIIFCPNRWYPFETHGHYWRSQYHFGNTPLINYLPDSLRNKLAPHVRTYTRRSLFSLLDDLPLRIVHHTRIMGAYDNIIARSPRLGRALRAALYLAEHTPLRMLGLSHLLILKKT